MPSWSEVLGDGSISRQKTLGMTRGFKPLHPALALPCRAMRVFTSVIEIATLTMFDPRQNLALRGAVTFQLIRDDHPGDILTAFEQLAEKLLRGLFVAPPLDEDVQDVVVLIHRAPEIMAFAIDC
jgi:hypothetical protein